MVNVFRIFESHSLPRYGSPGDYKRHVNPSPISTNTSSFKLYHITKTPEHICQDMTKMATMASSNNSSPIFTPATTPEGSVSEPATFIESMPSVNAGTPLIREWLSKWIVEHDLGSTVSGFQVAGINHIYWNGVDIRALDTRTMYRELDSLLGSWGPYWKMKEIYITAIMRDIKRARDFEVGHHHVRKKRQC
jgi:hypothetical protein